MSLFTSRTSPPALVTLPQQESAAAYSALSVPVEAPLRHTCSERGSRNYPHTRLWREREREKRGSALAATAATVPIVSSAEREERERRERGERERTLQSCLYIHICVYI
jgi:hypothetical protein